MKLRTIVFALTLGASVAAATPAEAAWPWTPRTPRVESSIPALPSYLAAAIDKASKTYNVDAKLIAAVAYQESRFDRYAVSSRGAQGLMQLMPRTAKAMGVRNSFDISENIMGGTKYLRLMLDTFNGDLEKSLAAYNAGPEAVKRKGVRATDEAVHYVAAVKRFYGTR